MAAAALTCTGGQRGSAATIARLVVLLLAAAVGVLAGAGAAGAASTGPVGPRIVNGSAAVAGAWPSIAYLGFTLSSVPSGIAVDAAGNVYTANYTSGTVSKITPGTTGTVDENWIESDPGLSAIAIDASGNVYVTNAAEDTVSKFDSAGDDVWTAQTGSSPSAVAVNSSTGDVYTANADGDSVTKVTSAGSASRFATTGAGPSAIAVDTNGAGPSDDVVYIANADAGTAIAFDSAGAVVWTAVTGAGPSGIAIDSANNAYTANATANSVTKITSAGSPSLFAATGARPSAIAIDAAGSLYTANTAANTITKITSAGVVTTPTSTGAAPVAIVVGATGIVYAANQRASTVTRIPTTGAPTVAWARIAERGASCTGSVIAPAVILTAAHCTMDELGIAPISGFARPGVIDAYDTSTQRLWDIADLLPHPGYDPDTFRNDVALVVLDATTGAPAMPLVAPWQDGLVVGGAPAAIAGWGLTATGASSPRYLRDASVPLISDAACARDMPAALRPSLDPVSMLCAGDLPAGIDTCQGDSGGPLAMTIAGTRTLVGDTSWGPDPCASAPGVYGRISAFRSWILDDLSAASELVRSHLMRQNAAARNLELRSTGPDVTLTWGVTPANWTTTGFRVTINGSVETITGPTTARTVKAPAGGTVSATVEPQVTLGTATSATLNATPIPTRAPVVTAPDPAAPRVGTPLTVTAATDDPWGGAPTYQWLVDGAVIPGATAATYEPLARQAGRRLSVRIAATNAAGTGTATIAAGRVRQAPRVAPGPVAVTGSARVGGRLQARPPAVGGYPQPRASYRWFRDGRRVPGATGPVYRVRPADAGALITGRVTWTNATGTITRTLRPTAIGR